MKLTYTIKADTVFSLLSIGFTFKASAEATAEVLDNKTFSIEAEAIEKEILDCAFALGGDSQVEAEQYFINVLKAYKEIPKFL